MITVSTVYNPFDQYRNHVRELEFSGGTVADYLPEITLHQDMDLVVARNGQILQDPHRVAASDGDKIAVSTRVQGTVGSAVATAIFGASNLGFWGTVGWYATAAITTVAIGAAVSYGMNRAVTALGLGPEQPDTGSGAAGSPTYSWGPLRQSETEGNPIPIVFGAHKVAGQVINQFITVESDDKEYLNMLLVVNDGQVDDIRDIRINDQPQHNFRGVRPYTRLGTLNDDPIEGFGRIVQQNDVQYKLADSQDSYTYQTDGDAIESIVVVVACPRGLYYSNDSGGLDERYVDLLIEYRAVGVTSWNTHDTVRISGATNSKIRRSYEISGLSPDQYEVRITRQTAASDSYRENTDIYWKALREIVPEQLIYPGLAKYAIKALATDQLSGQSPRVSCIIERNTVNVYNPNTSSWETRDAQNPAWATYALLNTYHDVHYSRILFDEFEEWAAYCDETVDGEPRFRVGKVFDSNSNAWKNIQKIASLGRASVLRRGTKYGVFVDKPESTVSHLFTIGNIIDETFNMQYLPMKDRANAVEITYVDPDRDYSNQVVAVYSDEYVSDEAAKKTSVKFNAAIPRNQAVREAAFRLNSNKYLVRTIEFEADIDSFACVVGDLVYFQHFIPHYDEAFGGRVVDAGNDDGSGNPYIQLDQDVELTAGKSYAVMVRLSNDSLVEKSSQTIESDQVTDTILLASSWTTVPERYDLYNFGPADTYKKPYRIISITRAQELTRKITALEYNENIYNDTSYVIENPTWGEEVRQEAIRVEADEYLTYGKGGDYQSNIQVSWDAATEDVGGNWDVWLVDETLNSEFEVDGFEDTTFENTENMPATWHIGRFADRNCTIGPDHLTQGHNYLIYVSPAGEAPTDTGGNVTRIEIQGKLAPPDDVTGFTVSWNSVKRVVNFTWDEVPNIDLSHYEIRQGTVWDDAVVVVKEGKKGSASVAIEEGVSETRTYLIKAVDTSGIYSVNYDSADAPINTNETPLQVPTGLSLSTDSSIVSDGTDRVSITATWDSNAEAAPEFDYYELRVENTSTGKVSSYTTTETQYEFEILPNTDYGVSLRAVDMTGNETAWTSQVTITSAKDNTAPVIPTWSSPALIPGFKVIGLRWQENTEYDLAYYQVQRSTTGAFSGEEVDLGNKRGNFDVDTDLAVSTQYYYRIRAVDTSGNKSDWSTVKTAQTLKVGEDADGSATREHIAYNSIIAENIYTLDLTTLTAKVTGTLSAGVLESNNWGTDQGTQIDLDNETVKFGGSNNPALSFDGATLSIDGLAIVNKISTNNVKIESGDGRTYFDGNTMYVYDANGNLRVKLGAL